MIDRMIKNYSDYFLSRNISEVINTRKLLYRFSSYYMSSSFQNIKSMISSNLNKISHSKTFKTLKFVVNKNLLGCLGTFQLRQLLYCP